jgi:hypothetical protein
MVGRLKHLTGANRGANCQRRRGAPELAIGRNWRVNVSKIEHPRLSDWGILESRIAQGENSMRKFAFALAAIAAVAFSVCAIPSAQAHHHHHHHYHHHM